MMKKIIKAIKEGSFKEKASLWIFNKKNKKNFNNDEKYLSELFKFIFGRCPDLNNPLTYNEKLLWFKLHWRDERCFDLVDKYKVRNYIKNLGLEEIIVPLYGVYNSWNEIDFGPLPNEFVIKTTHDGGNAGVVFIRDKSNKRALTKAKKKIDHSLKIPLKNIYKEWVYDKSERKIIIEKIIKDPNNDSLPDYKFFCFNGKAKFLFVGTERNVDVKFDFFDIDWNWIDVRQGHKNNVKRPKQPKNFLEMIKVAEKLSADFPHVRVDLYNVSGKIFFGEMTFFHFGGGVRFDPPLYDEVFGKFIDIKDLN